MTATDQAGEVEALRKGLAVARRAIMKAAQDTLWCDDTPVETVVDRIDALLAEADGQQSFAALGTQTATGRTKGGEVSDIGNSIADAVHSELWRMDTLVRNFIAAHDASALAPDDTALEAAEIDAIGDLRAALQNGGER